jgi:hypothetical protein
MAKQPLPSLSYPLSDLDDHVALAATDLTDHGAEPEVGLHNARLDYAAAQLLRNWLSDWLGHHRPAPRLKWTNLKQ